MLPLLSMKKKLQFKQLVCYTDLVQGLFKYALS